MEEIARPLIAGSGGGSSGKGGGTAAGGISEAPNSLECLAFAKVIDVLCEGPIGGLAAGAQSIYLDGTPLQNTDGTYNFNGITWHERIGTHDQDPIPFDEIDEEVPVGLEVKNAIPITRTVSVGEFDDLRVTVGCQAMLQQNGDGSVVGSAVDISIDVQPAGGSFIHSASTRIDGKTNEAYQRSILIKDFRARFGSGPWNVRVRRDTADPTTSNISNKITWVSYACVLNQRMSMPDVAAVGMQLDAKQFGSKIPVRSFDLFGYCEVHVPSNYDPISRTYTGIWNGNFKLAWTDNPAWWAYEIITNERWGLGDKISADRIDKWALYSIAQYCDELVPDGYGRREPRFTFNWIFQTQEDAINTLNAIAGAFLAMTYWGPGAVTFAQDAPKEPSHLANQTNVTKGQFNYSGTSLNARASVVYVTWNNPLLDYATDIEVVEDADLIAKYGWIKKDIVAIGCTRQSQARRLGKWTLDSEKNQPEAVAFEAGWEFADCVPGSITKVADPAYAGVRFGGRIASESTAETVKLDKAVTLEPGQNYTISIVMPDKTIADRVVTNPAGEYVQLSLDAALPQIPEPNAIWILSASNVAPRLFQCITNTPTEDGHFQITAIFHDPNKYARVYDDLVLEPQPASILPRGPLPKLVPDVREYLYLSGNAVQAAVLISWQHPSDPRVVGYTVEIQRHGEGWTRMGTTSQASFDIKPFIPGHYQFRVRCEGGVSGPWAYIENEIWGKLAPPSDISKFDINIVGTQASLTWDAVSDLDLKFYRIKFANVMEGATWEGAVEIATTYGTSKMLPAQVGTYLIKAVDDGERESRNAVLAVTNIAALDGLNVVEKIEETVPFPGTFEEVDSRRTVAVEGTGYIVLNSTKLVSEIEKVSEVKKFSSLDAQLFTVGRYFIGTSIDLGSKFTARLSGKVSFMARDYGDLVSLWPRVSARSSVTGGAKGKVFVFSYVRYKDNLGDPWSSWQKFAVGDYDGRYFEFMVELVSSDSYATPVVTGIEIEVDMPDRIEGKSGLETNATEDVDIIFDPAFHTTPAIHVTAGGMATGDYIVKTGETRTGFKFSVKNSLGTRKVVPFDYLAKGWGYEKTA